MYNSAMKFSNYFAYFSESENVHCLLAETSVRITEGIIMQYNHATRS